MGALLALLWMVAGVEPLMVWVAGFPFLCLPLCPASSHPTPPPPSPHLHFPLSHPFASWL